MNDAPTETAQAPDTPGFEPDPAVLAAAQQAIRPDAPGGDNVRYEPSYEALEGEIGKLEAIDAQPVDWRRVVELGMQILLEQSKDFSAACFTAHGLVVRKHYTGLAEGLALVHTLAATFWDDMFPPPKRTRARAAAVAWWIDRLTGWLAHNPPGEADAPAVVHAADTIVALEDLLGEKLGERAPALGDVRRTLTGYAADARRTLAAGAEEQARQPAPQPEAAAPEAAPAPDGEAAAATAAEPVQPAAEPVSAGTEGAAGRSPTQPAAPPPPVELPADTGGDVAKSLRQIQGALRPIAEHLRGQSLADPRAYRLLRTAMWLPVAQLPPNDAGQTRIPAVEKNVVDSLTAMSASGKHEAVIARAEETFVAAPFWLDAHRYTAAALEALGHAAARAAVEAAVREFLTRLPGLEELRLAGGQQVADEATRAWLAERVFAGDGAGSAGASGAEPWHDALREARVAQGERGFKAGLAAFGAGIRQADSARTRFLWRLQQAKYCLSGGRADVALPQFVALDDEVIQFGLHQWEPEIAIEVARNLMLSYRNVDGDYAVEFDIPSRIARLSKLLTTVDPIGASDLIGD